MTEESPYGRPPGDGHGMPSGRPPLPDHLSVDTLADHAEGLLDPGEQAAARAHLEICAACRASAADLADVAFALRSTEPVGPMPDEVALRLESALATESSVRAGSGSGPVVVPLRARSRRRVLPRVLAAAATVAVVGGVGYLTVQGRSGEAPVTTSAGAAADSSAESAAGAAAPLLSATTDAATRDSLATATLALAATADAARTGVAPLATDSPADDPAAAAPDPDPDADADATLPSTSPTGGPELAEAPDGDGPSNAACGAGLAAELGRTLLGSTPTTYAGQTGVLVALSGPTGDQVSGVVLPDCAASEADALAAVDVPRE